MENTRIKYLIATADEEDLGILGIYKSEEEAYAAMCTDFCKTVGIDQEDLEDWLEETDDADIDEMQARALDCTTEDSHNHDWQIFPIVSDGECRVATTDDVEVICAIYNTNCASGAVFSSPCRVNLVSGEVSNVGVAGKMADDDYVLSQTIVLEGDSEENERKVCDVQSVLDENNVDDALEILQDVIRNKGFWLYKDGTLADAIAKCSE